MRRNALVWLTAVGVAGVGLCVGAQPETGEPAPGAGDDGKIQVDPEYAKHGTVFFATDPMNRNVVTFTSEAPLEDIVGLSNDVDGYIVYDNNSPRRGLRGHLEVPVASLDTGIELRNEHLQSDLWLDADQYPKITFNIVGTQDVRRIKYTTSAQTYEMTLVGPLTCHGRTVRLVVPARVTFLRQTNETKTKMEGNLIAIRASFEVELDDLEITGPPGQDVIGTKVGETIKVDVSVFCTDKRPGW